MTKLTKKRNSGETLYLSKSLLSICITEMARKKTKSKIRMELLK